MAGEIQLPYTSHGSTLYAIVRNAVGQVWRTDSAVFETYTTANLSHYTISLIEQGTASQFYTGTFPSAITQGVYDIAAYLQGGGSAAEGDTLVGTELFYWSGSVVQQLPKTSTGGYVSPNWGDVGNPTTSLNLSGTTISSSQVVASVTGSVGSVTGAVGSVTGNVGGDVSGKVLGGTSTTIVGVGVWAGIQGL